MLPQNMQMATVYNVAYCVRVIEDAAFMMSDIQAAPSNIGCLVRLPYSFSLVGVCCASYSLHCIFLINLICCCEVTSAVSVCSLAALSTLYCAFMFFLSTARLQLIIFIIYELFDL